MSRWPVQKTVFPENQFFLSIGHALGARAVLTGKEDLVGPPTACKRRHPAQSSWWGMRTEGPVGTERPPGVKIESLEPEALVARLRESAGRVAPNRVMDDHELRHLVRVVQECSLLLKDVYTDRRIARILKAHGLESSRT